VLLVLGFTAASVLYGCKRFQNGPNFSVLSINARLVNDWENVKSFMDGKEDALDADDLDDTWKFNKNADFDIADPGGSPSTGTWKLDDSKKHILITPTGHVNLYLLRHLGLPKKNFG